MEVLNIVEVMPPHFSTQDDNPRNPFTNGKMETDSKHSITAGSALSNGVESLDCPRIGEVAEDHGDTVVEDYKTLTREEVSDEQKSQDDSSVGYFHAVIETISIRSSIPEAEDSKSYYQIVTSDEHALPDLEVASVLSSLPESGSPSSRGLVDTTAPFESVKEAVSKFGGILDWKAHKIQTEERHEIVQQELEKINEEIPKYRRLLEHSEEANSEVLKELGGVKNLVEKLKIDLEKAQRENHQAKQDSELAKLRAEEMEQGIADEVCIASKAQVVVAKDRHTAAISDLGYLKDELDALRKEFSSLVNAKDLALKKAEEAVNASKEVEKTVEELTIELISTKESLESAHTSHLEAEERRIGVYIARNEQTLNWEKELKVVEEELQRLNQQALSAKDLRTKLDLASAVLLDLKAELAAYMQLNFYQETSIEAHPELELEKSKRNTHTGIQAALASTKKELEEVKLNTEKAFAEVICLRVAATSLKSELENEKSAIISTKQREGMVSVAVSSLKADLEALKSEIAVVQMEERDARKKMIELPNQLHQAASEVDEAKSLSQLALQELCRAKKDAEYAKAEACSTVNRLNAARKEIAAAKASEKLALQAIKALQESQSTGCTNDEDSPSLVTLSLEEYYVLSKHAVETEEKANMKVEASISQIVVAKESELRSSQKLEEASKELAARKEALKISMEKAEKANEGKLGMEQELRKWRAEHEPQRKANERSQEVFNPSTKSASSSFEERNKSKPIEQIPPDLFRSVSTPTAYMLDSNTKTDCSPEVKFLKKKKMSLFPRILMFFARRKSHTSKST